MAKKKSVTVKKNKREAKKTAEKKILKKKKILRDEEIAMDFAQKAHERFDRMIKSSILFGSVAKQVSQASSDIDIILIIDDAAISWDLELIAWYREELGKLIASQAKEYGRDFHINTIKLTTWWQDLLHGDPVVVNILRYGDPLIDSGGFFHPLKSLLLQGKIRATPEAAYSALQRSPGHLARSRAAEMGAIEGVYWSMVDAAQAALITAKAFPPSPEHIPQLLKETFVDAGILKIGYVKAFRDLYVIHKGIAHGEISDIKGVEIDNWQEAARKFLIEMTRIIDRLIELKKGNDDQNKS